VNNTNHEWDLGDLKPVQVPDVIPARHMINPHLLTPDSKRWNNPRFAGGKLYFAVLKGGIIVRARRLFKRGAEAEGYASRLKARWIRLYDTAVAAMVNVEPSPEQL